MTIYISSLDNFPKVLFTDYKCICAIKKVFDSLILKNLQGQVIKKMISIMSRDSNPSHSCNRLAFHCCVDGLIPSAKLNQLHFKLKQIMKSALHITNKFNAEQK